jgi:hypothetical protein
MPSQITTLFPNIDESYPVAGVDNDTQGFRDNFDVIKTSLGVASVEITELQDITAKVNSANDFNGNDQSNLNIVSATEKTNNLGLVPGGSQLFPIQYRNGPYQYATLAADRTFQIQWGINPQEGLLQAGRLAKLTLQLSGNGGGRVDSVIIENGGSGYSNNTSVTFGLPGGDGVPATGTAIIVGGQITGVNITNPGSGYTSAPTITFTDNGGTGIGATATLKMIHRVNFAPSSAYAYDENFPEILKIGIDPVVIELWTFDSGARIYAKYIGTFAERS